MTSWQTDQIDRFFDSLKFNEYSDFSALEELNFGDLMNGVVDLNNRYVYKGSQVTPKCEEDVFWNIAQAVYPISSKHIAYLRQTYEESADNNEGYDIVHRGNYRVT